MICVDVGCAPRAREGAPGDEESILRLISRYHPRKLYGFDPGAVKARITENGTSVIVEPLAAWTYDGWIGFMEKGIRSHLSQDEEAIDVQCFDLAAFLIHLAAEDSEIILKLDVEGAEYTLLPHLHETGADQVVKLLLVEWHWEPMNLDMACPVELWL